MLNLKVVSTAGLVALLAACGGQTPYQPLGDGRYGYAEQKIDDVHYRVTFKGNDSTSRRSVENSLLRRMAELTVENGYDYFTAMELDSERFTEFGTVGPSVCGYYAVGRSRFPYYAAGYPWGFNTYTSASSRYEAVAFMAMGRGETPKNEPRAFDARSVLESVTSDNSGEKALSETDVAPAGCPTGATS